MSGLQKRAQRGYSVRYLSVSSRIINNRPQGVLIEQAPEGAEGAVSRINKNGKTVWEFVYDAELTGAIVNSVIVPSNLDGTPIIKISIADESFQRWQVEFPVRSSYGRSYMQRFANINPAGMVVISPYSFIPKGEDKAINGLNIYQGTEDVPKWYTNEAPNGVPPLIETMYQGKPTLDDTDRVNYLMWAHEQWASQCFADERARIAQEREAYSRNNPPQQSGQQPYGGGQQGYQYRQPDYPQQQVATQSRFQGGPSAAQGFSGASAMGGFTGHPGPIGVNGAPGVPGVDGVTANPQAPFPVTTNRPNQISNGPAAPGPATFGGPMTPPAIGPKAYTTNQSTAPAGQNHPRFGGQPQEFSVTGEPETDDLPF